MRYARHESILSHGSSEQQPHHDRHKPPGEGIDGVVIAAEDGAGGDCQAGHQHPRENQWRQARNEQRRRQPFRSVAARPSGHAAEGLAAALLVASLSPLIFSWMLVAGLAVAAGAVFGRYHYAIDAFTGWLVAIVVWLLLG